MKPDYGLMVLQSGLRHLVQYFYDVPLTHISVSAPGLYTSLLNKVHDGVEYAVSFDFGPTEAEALISKLPVSKRERVKAELSRAGVGQTIEFEEPILATLKTRLGVVERVRREEFVPLVVEQVL